jgi:N-acetylglutamate synthase-like GNAT family acetyltransferase
MALRKRREGELIIEQTRDLALVREMLSRAAMITDGIEWPAACYLLAYFGTQPAGVIGVEPKIDAALIRSLYVVDAMRRRGIGSALVAAARKAAHTRGARHLYLFGAEAGDFFSALGFQPASILDLTRALAGVPQVEYYRARPDQLAREIAYQLDISRDGLIDR